MVTSDGISDKDWDRVHELVVEIVNAGEGEEGDQQTAELLGYLDRLEEKYGVLPSILATRADYVEDPLDSLAVLKRAYVLAQERQVRIPGHRERRFRRKVSADSRDREH